MKKAISLILVVLMFMLSVPMCAIGDFLTIKALAGNVTELEEIYSIVPSEDEWCKCEDRSLLDYYYKLAKNILDWNWIRDYSQSEIDEVAEGLSKAVRSLTTHKYSEFEVTVAATCGTVGVARVYCSNCGDFLETKIIPATGVHTPVNVPAVAATCLTAGSVAGTQCSVCKDILSGCEAIAALGHDVQDVPAAEPTCDVNGLTAGRKCIRLGCDYVVTAQTKVPALGHSWKTTKTVDSTCYEKGYILKECQRKGCNATEVTDIPEAHEFSAFKTTKAPSCTEDGIMAKTCAKCKQVIEENIPKLEHTVSATKWVVFEDATCTKDGVKVQQCSVCKETVREAIPKLGHRNVEIIPGTPADCTLSGVQDAIKCKDCGQWLEEQVEIPALGHEWVDSGKSVAATCTTDGVDDYKCSRCPETKTGVVPATGHQNTETIPGTPADCTLSGVQDAIKCKDCGQWLKEQVEIPALGHDYSFKITATCTESGVLYYRCKRCGYCIEEAAVALGHDYIKEKEPTKESTCIGKGIWIYKCCRCGNIKEEDIPAKGHTYQLEWQTIIAPTCTETGVSIKICKDCFDIQTNTLSIISHSDADADNKCDMCSFDMTPPQPEEPEKPSENCGCSCHKSGIAKFFFNIGLFFQKIFKKNAVCDCGVAHY